LATLAGRGNKDK
jgi:hypothetical protein